MARVTKWIAPLLLAPFVVLALAQLVARDSLLPLVWASSATTWIYLPAWAIFAYALHRRRRWLAGCAAAVVACHAMWLLPAITARAESPPTHAARLRVATANVLAVNPRPLELLAELEAIDADVLVIEEVTPEWAHRLRASRLWDRYPEREIVARDDCFGIALLSRLPIRALEVVDLVGVPMIDARVDVHGRDVRVLGVHTLPPVSDAYASVWRAQLERITERARSASTPLVLLGDLNATSHAAAFEVLVDAGLRDVHDELGRGLASTWPNGVFPLPGIRLDHVMANEALAPIHVREGRGAGSDHRPIIAELALETM